MRRALFAALLLPFAAHAFLGTSFKVGVRDAATGQPLEGAFVVAREFATVGKFHGTSTYCVRADAARAAGAWVTIELPSPGTDQFTSARAIEAFAYRPGYCLARTADGAAASSYRHFHFPYSTPIVPLDPGKDTPLEMRRASQGPEERLLYLTDAALGLTCLKGDDSGLAGQSRWSARGPDTVKAMGGALLAEALALPRDRYEKALVERLRGRLAALSAPPGSIAPGLAMPEAPSAGGFTRDFIVGAPGQAVAWDDRRQMAIVAVRPGGSSQSSALVIRCRHGAPSACNLDERNALGETALYAYAREARPEEAKVMLEAGANPALPARPGGPEPIDIALRGLLTAAPGDARRPDFARVVDLLAANPKSTITQALKDDLAADPATWDAAKNAPGYSLLLERREALARLPARAEPKPGCESPGFDATYTAYREPPMRLRFPLPR